MHQANPVSQVIWYDSVTIEGKLTWQNELNEFNRYKWGHSPLASLSWLRLCSLQGKFDLDHSQTEVIFAFCVSDGPSLDKKVTTYGMRSPINLYGDKKSPTHTRLWDTFLFFCSIFFDECDAIFLNYTWNNENLINSALNSRGRLQDVYVGVDVFGRGMIGGGGYNTKEVCPIQHHALHYPIYMYVHVWS